MNGKGDTPRNCYTDQYRENYDRVFRTKKPLTLHEQSTGKRPIRTTNSLFEWTYYTGDLGTVKVIASKRRKPASKRRR